MAGYYMGNDVLPRETHYRGTGVVISDECKFHAQVNNARKTANNMIDRYKMYVRPHMEYCIEVFNPAYVGDILKFE